jgi:hypothetical protein
VLKRRHGILIVDIPNTQIVGECGGRVVAVVRITEEAKVSTLYTITHSIAVRTYNIHYTLPPDVSLLIHNLNRGQEVYSAWYMKGMQSIQEGNLYHFCCGQKSS